MIFSDPGKLTSGHHLKHQNIFLTKKQATSFYKYVKKTTFAF